MKIINVPALAGNIDGHPAARKYCAWFYASIPHMRKILSCMVVSLALIGCKSKSDKPRTQGGSEVAKQAGKAVAAPVPLPATTLVSSWEAAKLEYGSFKRPAGPGWTWEAFTANNDQANITMTFQKLADGDFRDQLKDLQQHLDEANQRDAPKFVKGEQAKLTIAGQTVLRSDATFDNGSKFATRDYIVVTDKGTVTVMTRGPLADKVTVYQLADYVVATFTK